MENKLSQFNFYYKRKEDENIIYNTDTIPMAADYVFVLADDRPIGDLCESERLWH